jgi:DNA primase
MDFTEQVKSSVDIVRTIGEYLPLKQQRGSSRYVGLCPFHTEKTPSFNVDGAKQFYYCHGCHVGGDVLKFVMEIESVSFWEARNLLAERNGVPIPKRDISDPESKLRGGLYDMHAIAAETFHANLRGPAGLEARKYLESRGVTASQIEDFGLGVSDPGGRQLVQKFESRFSPEQLEQSGLVLKRQEGGGFFDRFRGRLMFPIHNEQGKAIGFGGRALRSGDEPKYLNSPETPLYHKSYVLYNLHRAKDAVRKQDSAVLVEGYMDVIGVYSAGVQNVVASCGTALKDTQVRAIKRFSRNIVVNFDSDTAGASASEKSIQMLLDETMQVKVLELDGDLDPDEYVKQFGAEHYRLKLERAQAYFHWLADRARKKFDMLTVEGRLEGFKFVSPAIARISDRLERFAVANDIASYLGVDPKLVREQFRGGDQKGRKVLDQGLAVPANERWLLNALLVGDRVRAEVIPELRAMGAVGRFVTKDIFEALFAVYESGESFRYADLEGRLKDADRNLLSQVVFADELMEERMALDQAAACLQALRDLDPKAEIAELRAQIKTAERQGDRDLAMRLIERLTGLDEKSRKS